MTEAKKKDRCDICGGTQNLDTVRDTWVSPLASVTTICFPCSEVVNEYLDGIREYADKLIPKFRKKLTARYRQQWEDGVDSRVYWLLQHAKNWFATRTMVVTEEVGRQEELRRPEVRSLDTRVPTLDVTERLEVPPLVAEEKKEEVERLS